MAKKNLSLMNQDLMRSLMDLLILRQMCMVMAVF